MPPPRRPKGRASKTAGKKGSALDAEQEALLEQQRAVQEQIELLQRRIDSTARPAGGGGSGGSAARPGQPRPPAAAQPTPLPSVPPSRYAPETYLTGSHGPQAGYRHAASMAGARYMESQSMASRPRKRPKRVVLRRERAEGRIQTAALLIALAGALIWLASRYV